MNRKQYFQPHGTGSRINETGYGIIVQSDISHFWLELTIFLTDRKQYSLAGIKKEINDSGNVTTF